MCITSMKKKSYAQALLFGLASMATSGVTAADINGGNVRGIRPTDEDMVKMMQHRLAKADKESLAKADKESSKAKKEPKASKAKGPSKANKAAEGVWVSNLQKTGTCENDGGTRSCESDRPFPYAFSCYENIGEDTTVTQVRFWADQVGTKVDGKKPLSLIITGDEGRDFYYQELDDYNGGRNIIVLDDLKFFDQLDDGSDTISSVDGIGASISGAYFCVGLIPTFTGIVGEDFVDPIPRGELGIRSDIIDNADESRSFEACASDDTIPNLDEYVNIGDMSASTFCIEAKVVAPSSKGRALALPQKEVPSKDAKSPPPVERSLATVTPSVDLGGWMSNLNTIGQCSNNGGRQTCLRSRKCSGTPLNPPYGYFAQRFSISGSKTITQVKFWLDEVPVGSAPLNIVLVNELNGDVLYEQTVQTPQKGMNTVSLSQPATVTDYFFVGVVPAPTRTNTFVALQSENPRKGTITLGNTYKACECEPYDLSSLFGGDINSAPWDRRKRELCIEVFVPTDKPVIDSPTDKPVTERPKPNPVTKSPTVKPVTESPTKKPTPPTPNPPAPAPATCPIPCFFPLNIGCYFGQCFSPLPGCGRGSNSLCPFKS